MAAFSALRRTTRRARSSDGLSLRTLLRPHLRGWRPQLALVAVLAVLAGFAEAALLVLVARIATALAAGRDTATLSLGPLESRSLSMTVLILAAASLVALQAALQAVGVVVSTRVSVGVVRNTQRRLLQLFLDADWPLQASQRDGRLQELTTLYAEHTGGAVANIVGAATAVFALAALLVTSVFVNFVAALATGVGVLVIGSAVRPLRAAARRRSRRTAEAQLTMATGVTELATSLQEVRVFGVERPVRARLDDLVDRTAERRQSTERMSGLITVVYQAAAMGLVVGALATGYAVASGEISALGALALIMLRALTYGQVVQSSLQSLHVNAPYLEALREEEERCLAARQARAGSPMDGVQHVRFDDVSYEYAPGRPALRSATFSVDRGEIIGIIGPSGSGKSTLVQLLLRLRRPTSGTILVNGRDTNEFDLDEWYQRVTFVPQDAHLFAGTVAENIRFFRERVDDGDIERAARLANLHDEVMTWPRGYETEVGERGSAISGGQRQRLCIARALATAPEVVVLDEPTSALDVVSETLVRETLAALAPRATVFVIAHRLSTLSICDRIMIICNGCIQGFDEPAELEANDHFFREALKLSGLR